ncbi:MAG: hypothetical protein JJE04_11745 [Acidobacteriia bacterium]|nr:hypothetical protein [Terriglobia bacterium]
MSGLIQRLIVLYFIEPAARAKVEIADITTAGDEPEQQESRADAVDGTMI